MAVKKKSKKSEAVVETPAVIETPAPVIAPATEAVVESTPTTGEAPVFEGIPFRGGVILKDGRWTAALSGCKGTCEYVSKAGKTMICAVLDYRKIKAGTLMYTLVFLDRKNPERVTSTASQDKWGNTQVGFPAWSRMESKPGAGYISSLKLFSVG
jgi:hypothetical protein